YSNSSSRIEPRRCLNRMQGDTPNQQSVIRVFRGGPHMLLKRDGWLTALFLFTLYSFCAGTRAQADDWPQWLGPQRDAVWRETGIIEKFPEKGPLVRWRTPIAAGYTGPAVADGCVYVMDRVLAEGAKNPANAFMAGKI